MGIVVLLGERRRAVAAAARASGPDSSIPRALTNTHTHTRVRVLGEDC